MEPRVTAVLSRVDWDLDVEEAKDMMVMAVFEDLTENLDRYIEDPQDDEAVHDIRVDLRKLISMLYFFKPMIEEGKEQKLKEELKDVLKSFGSIREGDMLAKSLREFVEKEPGFRKQAESLISDLEKSRAEDVAISLERIDSRETHDKIRNLQEQLLDENLLKSTAADRARGRKGRSTMKMEGYAEERFKSILKRLKELAEEDDFEEIDKVHRYRIRCKKASYSLILAETVTSLETKTWVERLKDIQDVTGNVHDAQVNMGLLRKMKVPDRTFVETYLEYLDSIIKKRLGEFEGQLEEVGKSGIRLNRKD